MAEAGELLSLLGWFAVVAVAALGGFLLATMVRKWSQREERAENFTFQDLRDMHARGEINDREFAAMRTALLAGLKADDQAESSGEDRTPSSDEGASPS